MRGVIITLIVVLLFVGAGLRAEAQSAGFDGAFADAAISQAADPSGAKRFLENPGELVTLYGSRRYGPLYEPGRAPPPTDPETGWPLTWPLAPYSFVGATRYSPYSYRYSPYGYGFYRSYHRPSYVPYGYGYGWGYRYPFGYYPWNAFRYQYYRPWYDAYRPWYGYGDQVGHSPYIDHGPAILHNEFGALPHSEYGGCFYW
jgi:hypothetical protein